LPNGLIIIIITIIVSIRKVSLINGSHFDFDFILLGLADDDDGDDDDNDDDDDDGDDDDGDDDDDNKPVNSPQAVGALFRDRF
jgi:hypothetical protein